jgi:4-amino-4-deoxy-L-arabinose transferase-like glycosyltransferase
MPMTKRFVRFWRDNALFGVILIVAAGLRLWSLDFGLPFLYHIDEPAYVVAALKIAQGNLRLEYPPMSPSFQQLVYLSLFGFLFLANLVRGEIRTPGEFSQIYQLDPSDFYLLARSVSVICSLAAIVVLFFLVRRLRDRTTALLAALFLAVCFLDVRHAHFVEPYSMLTLFALLAVYFAHKHIAGGEVRYLLFSGLLTGLAIGIRISMATLILVPLYAAVFRWFSSGQPRQWISLLKNMALLGLAGITGLLIGVPGLIVNFSNTLDTILHQSALASGDRGFYGLVFSDLPTWQFYLVILELAWGVPLLLAIVLGIFRQLQTHRAQDILLAIFPLTFGMILLAASASSSAFARYLVPVLPFLAFLAADGIVWLVGVIFQKKSPKFQQLAVISSALLLIAVPLMRSVRLDYLWTQSDTRTQAKQWIESNIPEGSQLAIQWHGSSPSSRPIETQSERDTSKRLYPLISKQFYDLDVYRQNGENT